MWVQITQDILTSENQGRVKSAGRSWPLPSAKDLARGVVPLKLSAPQLNGDNSSCQVFGTWQWSWSNQPVVLVILVRHDYPNNVCILGKPYNSAGVGHFSVLYHNSCCQFSLNTWFLGKKLGNQICHNGPWHIQHGTFSLILSLSARNWTLKRQVRVFSKRMSR